MKVLQVCTYARGGAGKAAISYHRELLKQGIDSTILFRNASLEEQGIHTIDEHYGSASTQLRNLKHKLFRKFKLSSKPKSPERYSFSVSPFDITKHPAYQAADLIHLHWTYELLDLPSFLRQNTKPVIWTQHDECILLDGCHCAYGFPFEAYKDYSKVFNTHLTDFLTKQTVHLTAPSSWLTKRLTEDKRTADCPVHLLPNGLEGDLFTVKNRSDARQSLGLPLDKKIVLFIADFLDRPLKGLDQYIKMIQLLSNQPNTEDYLFLIVGNGTVDGTEITLDYQHFEYIDGTEKMSLLYNAANVYVTPTFADNLPYTVMESLFCGTPVAAFDVGGVSDLIKHGENGLLCAVEDIEALGRNVLELMTEDRFLLRKETSEKAIGLFSIQKVTRELIQLYENVLS